MQISISLIDTGVLVAIVDKHSSGHPACLKAFETLSSPPLTTWACLTEAFYLIGKLCGWHGQKVLLSLLTEKAVRPHDANEDEVARLGELMEQYKDTPMDFADATLVALAEQTGIHQILTLDDDFFVYRINGKDSFAVFPTRTPQEQS